ncbi:uncharacterized protein LOC128264974 isoform X2 [Drosophila gunungcola]|uniref:uncharacterized protein LOC128264974 isoform X2 n=1 Tax=Drosophila gunungcola TaxID=103775 RepID=UPI0022DEADB0|nr:uncharacterized protein LOC128264974 isoform X2 [Drosophila gunungcola]
MLLLNGSSQYKPWLKRFLDLDEGIHGTKNRFERSLDLIPPKNTAYDDYDYGDFTGYAYEGGQLPSNNYILKPSEGIMPKIILKENIGLAVYKNSKNGYENTQRAYKSYDVAPLERLNRSTKSEKRNKF